MNRTTVYCYSVGAACLACLIENPPGGGFWDDRWFSGALLAAAVPVCVAGAWLAENRPVKAREGWYAAVAVGALLVGMAALAVFLLSYGGAVTSGFTLGLGFSLWVWIFLGGKAKT